ncbi:MAG: DUF1223 domain-containing protein, partial [Alphaproteobacteria bacterium]
MLTPRHAPRPCPGFRRLAAAVLVLAGFAAGPAEAAETAPPAVVVELFTSQGCSTCPPADAFLAELSRRPDIVALEFHVGLWDFLGWNDPLAKAEFSERQHGYLAAMGGRYPYTPQMVIGGRRHEIGSNRDRVEQAILAVQASLTAQPDIAVRRLDSGHLQIDIGAAAAKDAYDLVLVAYDSRYETDVENGRNKGRRLVNTHVVRSLERIGSWSGSAVSVTVPMPRV